MTRILDPDEMPKWLAKFFRGSKKDGNVLARINEDDCAILRWNDNLLVATLDFLNANPIALELSVGGLYDLGRLLIASNISDLCGSGAKPIAVLVGITLPHGSAERDFKAVMRGIKQQAELCNVVVIGGDTKLGNNRALVAVAIGSASSPKSLFLKKGAKAGDVIWSSGRLGGTAAAAWGYRKPEFKNRWRAWAKTTLLVPNLPMEMSRQVASSHLGRGGTDISDGLGADLRTLCEASGVGAVLYAQEIPVASQVIEAPSVAGAPAWAFALACGGDFQFIVTTHKMHQRKMVQLGFWKIGRITTERGLKLRLPDDTEAVLMTQGHRDRRGLSFVEEIDMILKMAAKSHTI
jgi:thiamine-monophosphate kinase